MRTGPGLRVIEELPVGVTFLRHYRHGADLLECGHDGSHHRPTVAWIVWRGDRSAMQSIDREQSREQALERAPEGFDVLDYEGYLRCVVCGGDEFNTSEFRRPVKMYVKLAPGALEPKQGGLF